MKNVLFRGVGLVAFLLFASLNASAQSSKINQVLADTTFLKATMVTLEPGQKTDMHSHPAHFFYALTDGKLLVHFKDGKEETYDLKQGFSMAAPPERPHVSENGGTKTLKFLIVELKDYPYKGK
jgi:quercetin dioxygenase-like cupin family protein